MVTGITSLKLHYRLKIFAENSELYKNYAISKWVCLQQFLTEEMVHSIMTEFARLVNFQTTYTCKCAT